MSRPPTASVQGPLWGRRAADWADVQEPTARPVYEAVLDHLGIERGMAVLDVGCGSGMAAMLAAARGAAVAGVDAAPSLLDIARQRVPTGEFCEADLETLPFADGRFDAVVGFNAFQYAGDPVTALREAGRVARAFGRVAIAVWGDPAAMEMAHIITALAPLLPAPPPGTPGPFALSVEGALEALAAAAGLVAMERFDVAGVIRYPDLATALRGLNASGVAARAIDHAGEGRVSDAHRQALAAFRQGDGSYAIGSGFVCLIAGTTIKA